MSKMAFIQKLVTRSLTNAYLSRSHTCTTKTQTYVDTYVDTYKHLSVLLSGLHARNGWGGGSGKTGHEKPYHELERMS